MKPWSRGREAHQPLPLRPQASHRNGHIRKESKQRETTDYSYCFNKLECAAGGVFVLLVTNMGKTVNNELSGWHLKIVCSGSYLLSSVAWAQRVQPCSMHGLSFPEKAGRSGVPHSQELQWQWAGAFPPSFRGPGFHVPAVPSHTANAVMREAHPGLRFLQASATSWKGKGKAGIWNLSLSDN